MAAVTMKQLLEAGVHFGHQTRRWNPKMRPYIFGERNDIHIIDLNQTLEQSNRAYEYVRNLVKDGGSIMFVGTKKQVAGAIADAAERAEMPYVNFRWLGGMLTNFQTIQKRIFYMKELRRMEESGDMDVLPKKERLRLRREFEKLNRNLGGVADLTKLPNALFVIDINVETTAVKEANRLGLPVVGLVDSNCDPDGIEFVIPGNDDAVRSAHLIASMIADACVEGKTLVGKEEMDEAVTAESGETAAETAGAETGEGAASVESEVAAPDSKGEASDA